MRDGDRAAAPRRRGVAVRTRSLALAIALALLAALMHLGSVQSAVTQPLVVAVSFDARHPGVPVQPRFLGLSFELSSLRQITAWADRGDLVAMLRSLGPGMLRFGGVSADTRVAWTDAATPRAPWASQSLEETDLRALRRLAERSGWRVLLTIGIGHYEPAAAAREAAAAHRTLGRWLAGIELGNEPDAYARHGLRSLPWSFRQYDFEALDYRSAIARDARRIPIAGPDVSGSHAFNSWGRAEAHHLKPALLTGHHYPFGCAQVTASTLTDLLSVRVRHEEDLSLRRYMAVSRGSGIGFRLDEANTVSCGGVPGVSNTFASALWAVSYLTRAMAAGVSGINLHGNPANCNGYTPLCAPNPNRLADGALQAQPEWYALLLAKALTGDRPLRTAVSSPAGPNVDVRAFQSADGSLKIAIDDEEPPGAPPLAVRLHVRRGYAAATALRLTAPSLHAGAGVELGGSEVSPAGSWREPAAPPGIADRAGVVTVEVSPASAVLVTVPRRAGHG
jgi:hypothetical protein